MTTFLKTFVGTFGVLAALFVTGIVGTIGTVILFTIAGAILSQSGG